MKCWQIKDEHIRSNHSYGFDDDDQVSYTQDEGIFDDRHNAFILSLISKHISKIVKLEINLQTTTVRDRIFAAYDVTKVNEFKSCIALQFGVNPDCIIPYGVNCSMPKIAENMFTNLECLELYRITGSSFDAMQQMLKVCGGTLKCFKLYKYDNYGGDMMPYIRFLQIPSGVEWLSVINTNGIGIDMSACKHVLAVQLIGVDVKTQIIGPTKDENMITFACIGDCDEVGFVNEEKKEFDNIKFVCPLKQRRRNNINFMGSQGIADWKHDVEGGLVVINGQKRVNIDEYLLKMNDKKMKKEKYLKLDERSCDEYILGKLLRYAMKDDGQREEVEKRLQKWWGLNSANWIKDLCLSGQKKKT